MSPLVVTSALASAGSVLLSCYVIGASGTRLGPGRTAILSVISIASGLFLAGIVACAGGGPWGAFAAAFAAALGGAAGALRG